MTLPRPGWKLSGKTSSWHYGSPVVVIIGQRYASMDSELKLRDLFEREIHSESTENKLPDQTI
jgi:hypothetical protein